MTKYHYTDPIGLHETTKDDSQVTGYGWNYEDSDKDFHEKSSESSNSSSDSSSGDSSSSSGGECSSGGGCYVTTACLDALGLPKDSLEMRAMKTLTKEHILKSFQGKKDYVLYGRRGPAIVQAIKSREDSKVIWMGIYEKLRNVTANVLSSNYEKGHQIYKELILGLEKKFC